MKRNENEYLQKCYDDVMMMSADVRGNNKVNIKIYKYWNTFTSTNVTAFSRNWKYLWTERYSDNKVTTYLNIRANNRNTDVPTLQRWENRI